MLGKLLKYEWKGLRLPFLIMLIVLVSTTVLTCGIILTINPEYDDTVTGFSFMALIFSIFLYYFGIIGCSIGTSLIIVIRFYKTCYTDQGYLTHTLPVTTKQHLNAKIIAAVVTQLLLMIAIAISLFIIIQVGIHHMFSFIPDYAYDELRRTFAREFSYVYRNIEDELGIRISLFITYMVVCYIISMIANTITTFGCVSLGQLFAKHRVIGAIAAYFIVQLVMSTISFFASTIIFNKAIANGSYTKTFDIMSPSSNLTLILSVILAVAMYFANLHMMTKKLNLE